ncbi:tRNA-2-methylthio-N(6)-dimethylallyladenosine synthase [Desulfovibrionales bacterium]
MALGFHIQTFGCQMNINDSAWLARALEAQGFELLAGKAADVARVFILNACSVREKPEQKMYAALGRLRRFWERDDRVFAVVGGCVTQHGGKGLFVRFPFVRLIFGTDSLATVPQAILRLCLEPGLRLSLIDFSEIYPERDQIISEGRLGPTAFVNIMQGCDNYCAYCIVPFTRGRQRSRPAEAILAEIRELVAHGVREVTMLGQNVNSYGLDAAVAQRAGKGGHFFLDFAGLLRQAASVPGLLRIRFTTSHPKDLSKSVIAAFGELPTLCPHLHLPLQSGSDRVLAAMGRRYNLAYYLSLVEALRRARPDVVLTTDIIVGFPGETEVDFKATLQAVRQVGYISSYSFRYSDRPGTRATQMALKVPEAVKAERLERLQKMQEELTSEYNRSRVGRLCEVLIEGASKRPQTSGRPAWSGRDGHGLVVNLMLPSTSVPAEHPVRQDAGAPEVDLVGCIVMTRITEAKKHSLCGEVTGDPW